jgi:hypothetical protein
VVAEGVGTDEQSACCGCWIATRCAPASKAVPNEIFEAQFLSRRLWGFHEALALATSNLTANITTC